MLEEYYTDITKELAFQWDDETEQLLHTDDVICVGGEEEISTILSGNFEVFNRDDCSLRHNDIFRWGWESWRLAVGNDIGQIYPYAISVMNVGAQANGNIDKYKIKISIFSDEINKNKNLQVFMMLAKYGVRKLIFQI